ncbi:MAG: TVP38/TMEM64 family protein [Candidatus Omnitrophica bacterium]|nr:TVP38/TMEM64 family protein [Candidatus Omnitrophota bacterium]
MNKDDTRKLLVKVVFFMAFAIVLFAALRMVGINYSNMSVVEIKEGIKSYGAWAPFIYILIYQIRPFILLPSTMASLAAGIIWGWEALIYIYLASIICATWQFFTARYFARDAVEKMVNTKAEEIKKYIEKNSLASVILIRMIPNVAWDIQNLILGLTKIKYWKYILGTIIGILPGSIILVYFGDSLVSVLLNPQHWWKMVLAVSVLGGIYWLQKNIREKESKKEIKDAYCDDDQHL